jgi:hypothetical protein
MNGHLVGSIYERTSIKIAHFVFGPVVAEEKIFRN